MKIVVSPDKFKGSLTSTEVCDAVENGILSVFSDATVIKHPLGDGGEGTLDILASNNQMIKKELIVNDPLFRPISSYYYHIDDTAYIELALSSGLPLLEKWERNVNITTTLGTGELILDAIETGCKKIYLMIGGSSSNDAGMGILQALGFRFLDDNGNELKPIGESLIHLKEIDDEHLLIKTNEVSIQLICDVKNPFYGINGAAHVYAKQKGLNSDSDIPMLDNGLRNFANVILEQFDIDICGVPGAGAGGGVGGGLYALLNSELLPGIETLLKMTGFEEKMIGADLIITGEGKIDSQTPNGKVVQGVIDYCQKKKFPVGLLCGIKQTNYYDDLSEVLGPYEIKNSETTFENAISFAASLLSDRTKELMLDFKSAR